VELWSGEQLEHREVARPGDFLFIPANVPHVAVNRGATPAVFVGVRDEPTAQESCRCARGSTRGCPSRAATTPSTARGAPSALPDPVHSSPRVPLEGPRASAGGAAPQIRLRRS